MPLWALDRRARALGFTDLGAYLDARYAHACQSLSQLAAELGTSVWMVRAAMDSHRVARVAGSLAKGRAYLTRAGGHYITGVKMREGLAKAAETLARQGRYQHVRDNLRVKESGWAATRSALGHLLQRHRGRTRRQAPR